MLTGAARDPGRRWSARSTVELGEYELEEPFGRVTETGRAQRAGLRPAGAHRGRAVGVALSRRAGRRRVGRLPHVRDRRPDNPSVLLRLQHRPRRRCTLARFLDAHVAEMRRWLAEREEEWISSYARSCARSRRTSSARCATSCGRSRRGDACGPNMMTRNAYALNIGYVLEHAPVKPERAILEANMGGDKKPSHRYFERGGHGKTVLVEVTLTDDAVRRVLRTTVDDLLELSFAGHARGGRVRDAVGRLHARVGDRRDLRGHRSGPRHGRDELDGARNRPARRGRASTARCGCRASRSARSAAGRRSRTRARGSS